MARLLRPVPLEFADSAPVRMSFAAEVTAAPAAVHRALAEDVADWPAWFAAVSWAEAFEGGRKIRLRSAVRFT
jgi:hypothetical protein